MVVSDQIRWIRKPGCLNPIGYLLCVGGPRGRLCFSALLFFLLLRHLKYFSLVALSVVAFALADYVLLCLVAAFEKNLPQNSGHKEGTSRLSEGSLCFLQKVCASCVAFRALASPGL